MRGRWERPEEAACGSLRVSTTPVTAPGVLFYVAVVFIFKKQIKSGRTMVRL